MRETTREAARAETGQQRGDGYREWDVTSSKVEPQSKLMERMAGGDEAALDELVAMHGHMLLRLIGRLTGWHGDIDDIFQEVLLTAWRRAHRYREQGSCEAWLKRIAVNRVKNHHRTLSRIQRKLELFADRLASFERRPTAILPHEANEPMQLAMRKLKEADRTLIVLVYLEELPIVEVAELVGIKQSTLHVRLHRARERLKALILQQEPEDQHE